MCKEQKHFERILQCQSVVCKKLFTHALTLPTYPMSNVSMFMTYVVGTNKGINFAVHRLILQQKFDQRVEHGRDAKRIKCVPRFILVCTADVDEGQVSIFNFLF